MPDIDIDFDDLRRGEVIEYVKQKYGEENVTQIITFGTHGGEGRDARRRPRARAARSPRCDRIAKLVPDGLGMTLERALELSPELKSAGRSAGRSTRGCCAARACSRASRATPRRTPPACSSRPGRSLDYVPLYRQKDESHDAVGHEVGREGRAPQDGLPRPAHAVRARRGACGSCAKHRGVDARPREAAARRRRRPTSVFQDAETVGDLPVRVVGHARLPAQAASRPCSRTWSR